jgi:acyl dehydratase
MPINPDAVGAKSEPMQHSWTSDDALLYAVGVGAGSLDPVHQELEFTTENTENVEQKVLPTMAVVLGGGGGALDKVGPFDFSMLVHGEQAVELHREIPVEGTLESVAEVIGIYDKGSAVVIVTEARSKLLDSGEPLFTTRSSVFIRGEGGFGGDRGPSGRRNVPPERSPDHSVTYQTRPDQALLYRLTGDHNPLHTDPVLSAKVGFATPILHGLCTYGFTGRALLHTLCGSDPTRFKSIEGRFSSPVLPGEALTIHMWVNGSEAIFQTQGGDGRVVLDAGLCKFG